MLVRRFLDSDYPLLTAMNAGHGLTKEALSDLPHIGFIAMRDRLCIGALFLRKCEGRVGMLESLVTNNEAKSLDRHEAIDKLVATTLKEAEYLGLKRILAYSVNESIISRAKDVGFKVSDQILMYLGV